MKGFVNRPDRFDSRHDRRFFGNQSPVASPQQNMVEGKDFTSRLSFPRDHGRTAKRGEEPASTQAPRAVTRFCPCFAPSQALGRVRGTMTGYNLCPLDWNFLPFALSAPPPAGLTWQ